MLSEEDTWTTAGTEILKAEAAQKRMRTYVYVVKERGRDGHILSVHLCVDEAMQACAGAHEVVHVMQVR